MHNRTLIGTLILIVVLAVLLAVVVAGFSDGSDRWVWF